MAAKVDQRIYDRILQLKAIGLTNKVIAIRLGISDRTVRIYTRAARLNLKPYQRPEAETVPS